MGYTPFQEKAMFQECRHLMPNGSRCHSPALREKSYCYYHQHLHAAVHASRHKKRQDRTIDLASIEDAAGIHIALTQVVDAMTASRIDRHHAGTLIYGLHLASSLARQRAAFDPSQVVRDVYQDADGSFIAAEEPLD
jgi:hypothetical protein